MAQKKISANEIVADIRAEMSDESLMAKYDLSPQGLEKLLQQLVNKGFIREADLAHREEIVLAFDIIEEQTPVSAPSWSGPKSAKTPSGISSSQTASFKQLIAESVSGNPERVQELFNTVQAFLDRGADVNTETDDGYTALMLASGWGRSDVVKLLLDRGADMNAENSLGMTALMNASSFGHNEVVGLLLDAGANLRAQSKEGWTAIRLASAKKHHAVAKLLKDRGAKDIQARPVSDVPRYYLTVFNRMESEDKTRIVNIYALIFSIFWVFFKGMWKKGLVYVWVTIVIDILCEILFRHNFGLIIAGIGLCFIGNWDYYLYRLHGDAFFNQRWWDGIRSGTLKNVTNGLTPVVEAHPTSAYVVRCRA